MGALFNKKTIKGVPKNEENLKPTKDGYHMYGQNIKYQYSHKIKLDNKYLQVVDSNYPILAYTSSVGEIGLIKESFYRSGNNGAFQGLFPKNYKFKLKELQFIEAIIKKQFNFFGYGTGMSNIMELKIQLPTKNGKIDFLFMESFIAELEAQRIAELEAYLLATGLKDYNLTTEEKQVLEDFESGKFAWKHFKMGGLFDFMAIKQAKSQGNIPTDDSEKGIPYVVQSLSNNMVSRNVNKSWLINNNESPVSGNRIVLGVTLPAVSYQPKEFGASQVITGSSTLLNNKNGHFISAVISKLMYKFSYGNKPGMQIYKEMDIQLPSQTDKPNYALMETFISAIQKLVIKDVVLYADKKIETTKSVIQN